MFKGRNKKILNELALQSKLEILLQIQQLSKPGIISISKGIGLAVPTTRSYLYGLSKAGLVDSERIKGFAKYSINYPVLHQFIDDVKVAFSS